MRVTGEYLREVHVRACGGELGPAYEMMYESMAEELNARYDDWIRVAHSVTVGILKYLAKRDRGNFVERGRLAPGLEEAVRVLEAIRKPAKV